MYNCIKILNDFCNCVIFFNVFHRCELKLLRAMYPNSGYSAETGGIMKNLRTSTDNAKVSMPLCYKIYYYVFITVEYCKSALVATPSIFWSSDHGILFCRVGLGYAIKLKRQFHVSRLVMT